MDRAASSWATSTSGRIESCMHKCQQQKLAMTLVASQRTARRTAIATKHGVVCRAFSEGVKAYGELWVPDETGQIPLITAGQGASAAASYSSSDDHKARTPPPDLPSLLLDSRIVFLGMPLVPAVTELIIAELLYLQYKDRNKPMFLYINSTGTTRADGETVGFETEGTAIYDAMRHVRNEVHTVAFGMAMGQACMLLASGHQGKRFMLPHTTAMLQQPRVPTTGQRQAIEIQIKWREVLAQKQAFLKILSKHTGHSMQKLDADWQRPLYMTPRDAIEYGIADGVVKPRQAVTDTVKKPEMFDKVNHCCLY